MQWDGSLMILGVRTLALHLIWKVTAPEAQHKMAWFILGGKMPPCYFVFCWLFLHCRVLEGYTKWITAPSMPPLTYCSPSWEHDILWCLCSVLGSQLRCVLRTMFPMGLFLNTVTCPNLVTLADVQFISLGLSMLSGCRETSTTISSL